MRGLRAVQGGRQRIPREDAGRRHGAVGEACL